MYKRAIIIGGGASIPEDFKWDLLKDEFTFGINYIYRLFEPTSLIFDNDGVYNNLKKDLQQFDSYLISHHCKKEGVLYIPADKTWYGRDALKKRKIYTGTLTGIYALTLANCLPFQEIYLMGYDCNRTNGLVHLKGIRHLQESLQAYHQTHRFSHFKKYKHIFNVSPNSAIDTFPKLDYKKFYEILENKTQCVEQEEARKWLKHQIFLK